MEVFGGEGVQVKPAAIWLIVAEIPVLFNQAPLGQRNEFLPLAGRGPLESRRHGLRGLRRQPALKFQGLLLTADYP
jgi:hypothetical protein